MPVRLKQPFQYFMEQEFTELLQAHPGLMHKVCRLYADTAADRQDLFQEIVLQLWRAFPGFRQLARPSTWLYRVALNTAITTFRQGQRRPRATALSEDLSQQLADWTDPLPDERHGWLYAAIAQLPPVDKALITLYLDDHSYAEIAAILGISPGHVGVKLTRLRLRLQQLAKPLTC